jgi:hypothetical protein
MAQPVKPEPKFFIDDDLHANGIDWYEQTYFASGDDGLLRGEKSASYLESDTAAARIAEWFPDASIIVMLRDPVRRAVSNYWYSVDNGLEPLPMAEALSGNETGRAHSQDGWYFIGDQRISASPFAYRRRGRYVEDLRVYARHFGPDQMKILVFEDTVDDPGALADLFEFLRVDADFTPPSLHEVVNPGHHHRSVLPPDLERDLSEHFSGPNAELAAEFDLDLSRWQTDPAHRS